jgi:hypothetical protein
MAARSRLASSLVAFAALAGTALDLLGAHAHAFGEVDRVVHSLVEVDHPPAAGGGHLDRAVESTHPVCATCALAALPGDGAGGALPAVGLAPAAGGEGRLAALPPGRPTPRHGPARAPPAS